MSMYLISKRVDGLYRKFGRVGFCIAIVLIFFGACYLFLDPDFGWHLQAGNYIRSQGVPSHDIFTYTARGFPWIDHEWLNDVIVSWLYGLGGYLAAAMVFTAIWTAALIGAARRRNWALLAVAATAILPYAGIRPVAWTVLFLVILERMIGAVDRRILIAIPAIFLIWANLHGGFLVGLAVLWLEGLLRRRRDLLLVLVGGILASFINPYGPRLYVELFRTLGDSSLHYNIVEWLPFYFTLPTLLFFSYAAALFLYLEKDRLRSALSVPAALYVSALLSNRNAPLFVVGSLRHIETYLETLKQRLPSSLSRGRQLVLMLMLAGPLFLAAYSVFTTFHPAVSEAYPASEVSYLDAHPCTGNLFNSYDFGGYLIWKLPGKPVYIDGRMPSWRLGRTNYFTDYNRIFSDAQFRRSQFKRYNVRCALIGVGRARTGNFLTNFFFKPRNHPKDLTDALRHDGWRVISTDRGSVLLEK